MSAFEQSKLKKRYLPSTYELSQLRKQIVNSELREDIERSEVEQNLCNLSRIRDEVQNFLSNGKKRIVDAKRCFLNVFEIFSNFPSDHDYYLPPLYKSGALGSILDTAIKRLLQREVGMITGSHNNRGHLVLGGVEGAGKTTLMRALALSSAALLEKMIPICHDYLSFKKPEDILWEALGVYYSVEPDCERDPLEVLVDLDQEAFLLFDEFQHNFRFADDPSWLTGRDAAITFHRYSRTWGTFCVIGGSSVDMHSLMFQQGRGESTDHWRKRGYPNFNGTLYELYTVPALRTADALEAYVRTRYPLWDLENQDVSLLLAHTGGIGRWVHVVWEESLIENPDPDNKEKIPLCSADCLRACTAYRKVKHEKVLECADNRELIAYLLITAQPQIDALGNISHCGGVDKVLLRQALTAVGVASPSDVIEKAAANSIIYIDADSMDCRVQFSRPLDAVIFSSELPPAQLNLLLLSAVHLMIHGISSSGSDNVTDVNAGYALADLVRDGVYTSAGINEYAQFDNIIAMTINSDKQLCILESLNGLVQPLTLESLQKLNRKHLRWKQEYGLDGVCFDKDASQDNSWYLDLWQCKGGRWDIQIRGGNNSMKTALNNYKKKYQSKDVGDKQITEIVLKAQVGICLIVQALRRAIPGVIIKPRRLVVTTTKQCSVHCVQTLKSWQSTRGIVIEKDVLSHFCMTSRSKSDKALKSRFEVRVESGCEWVVDAIADPGLRLIANQLLLLPIATSISSTTPIAKVPTLDCGRPPRSPCTIM